MAGATLQSHQHIFVAIEGIDGVGKSTIATELSTRLNNLGIPTLMMRSPVGDYQLAAPYVNNICDVDSHYLFYLSGVKHTSEEIRKALGHHSVVCDRYIFSTLAYHIANNASAQVDIASLNILKPDFAFYISVSDEQLRMSRILGRGKIDPGDQETRQKGSLVEKIEQEFARFGLISIDNTNRPLNEVVNEILTRIE